jgi:hypothetical protein
MECFVAVASHNPADDSYDCMANFQGPFSTHPVMARALRMAVRPLLRCNASWLPWSLQWSAAQGRRSARMPS